MSNPALPPETVDHIVDMLYDQPKTLRKCSLVAKSWVPRTRIHLFADIELSSPKALKSWKKAFPDPSNSPAFHTLTLSLKCGWAMTAADVEGGWIQAFSRVVRLDLWCYDPKISLPSLHGFSPVLKSLRLSYSRQDSHVLNFVCSFPLLEDLTLISDYFDEWDSSPTINPRLRPHSPGPSSFPGSGGPKPLCDSCWTYRTALTFGSSFSRTLTGKTSIG